MTDEDEKRVLVVYRDYDEVETFPLKDLEYWIRRRMTRMGVSPHKAYIIESDFDIQAMAELIRIKLEKEENEAEMSREKQLYLQLKKKFEG